MTGSSADQHMEEARPPRVLKAMLQIEVKFLKEKAFELEKRIAGIESTLEEIVWDQAEREVNSDGS